MPATTQQTNRVIFSVTFVLGIFILTSRINAITYLLYANIMNDCADRLPASRTYLSVL